MCISSGTSFALAGALSVGGGYCIYKATRLDRSYLPLASIPVVFAVQQFCEGWVWTGLDRGDAGLAKWAGLAFVFFALFVWPVWIPYSMLLVERSRRTARFLSAMTGLGLAIGLALLLPIVLDPGMLAIDVTRDGLHYNIGDSPTFRMFPDVLWEALYLIVVATPLLVSSTEKMVHCGVAVIVSAAVTRVFFDYAFASVWCLFAAALSLYISVVVTAAGRRDRDRRGSGVLQSTITWPP